MDMTGSADVARVLFGFSAQFHYLFVPLTIGLMAVIAVLDLLALGTGDGRWERAARFWGRFFLLNFVCGILTGWPLRYQLSSQWSGFSHLAGDVLTHVFTIEAHIAPLLFALVIAFALRQRLPAALRPAVSVALLMVLVAQSLAILALNAWMQMPVGGVMAEGRFRLDDPAALFSHPLWASKVVHTLGAAGVMGGVFALAISAWLLLRGRHGDIAQASLRPAALVAGAALLVTGAAGHESGDLLRQHQPAKFAAIEALWTTADGPPALTLLAWPDAATRSNRHAVELPGVLHRLVGGQPLTSLQDIERDLHERLCVASHLQADPGLGRGTLAQQQHVLGPLSLLHAHGLRGAPACDAALAAVARRALPPVAPVFFSFRVMVGAALLLLGVVACFCFRTPDVRRAAGRRVLWLGVAAFPLPWIATIAGWMVCEVGRQPWVVTGLLSTGHAAGPVPAAVSALVLLGASIAATGLLSVNVVLSLRWIRLGLPPSAGPAPAACLPRPRWPTLALQAGSRGS
jgi:cytochrome d ubiquinol oxidase subunit I